MTIITTYLSSFIDLGSITASAGFGTRLQKLITNIIGPIFLAIMGVIAITFLIQRQIMQFVIFLVIGILIAALIYAPAMIRNLGTGVGGEVKW